MATPTVYLCIRVDLDYVPWDSPDAGQYGHGEPAMLLRMLDLARYSGVKYHFFVSNRVLRAFPASVEAVLNDGHDLDWFCKHPEHPYDRLAEAQELLRGLGHTLAGCCIRGMWSGEYPTDWLSVMKFVSSVPGATIPKVKHFPVETRADRDAIGGGSTLKSWADTLKGQVRDAASRRRGMTLVVRPQVLASWDPRLSAFREIVELAQAVGLPNRTYRELL